LGEEGGSRAESLEVLSVPFFFNTTVGSNRRPSTPLGGVLVNTTTSTKERGKPDDLFISRQHKGRRKRRGPWGLGALGPWVLERNRWFSIRSVGRARHPFTHCSPQLAAGRKAGNKAVGWRHCWEARKDSIRRCLSQPRKASANADATVALARV
jgi:hypothetical protein